MKKPGIILSVIIGTIMFIYAMSFVSSQNVCSGVRSYQCSALQKKANDDLLAQQADEFAKMIEASTVADNTVQPTVVETTPVAQKTVAVTPKAVPRPVQQTPKTTNTQQAAATQQAQQEAAAAKLAAQQAADKLAAQQAAAKLAAQQAAAKKAADAAVTKLAAQKAAAAAVNTTTRAS